MIKLRKYKSEDANHIIDWLDDEMIFYQWSADRYGKYPINANDINNFYLNSHIEHVFTATDEKDRVIGHFILRYPDEKDKTTLRIGFVIIDNSLRGQGIGKRMICEAIKYSFNMLKAEKLTIGVFENNAAAFRCYKSCGFDEIEDVCEYKCKGEIWNCIEMQITSEKYKQIFKF